MRRTDAQLSASFHLVLQAGRMLGAGNGQGRGGTQALVCVCVCVCMCVCVCVSNYHQHHHHHHHTTATQPTGLLPSPPSSPEAAAAEVAVLAGVSEEAPGVHGVCLPLGFLPG
jgi:hypothetical protein